MHKSHIHKLFHSMHWRGDVMGRTWCGDQFSSHIIYPRYNHTALFQATMLSLMQPITGFVAECIQAMFWDKNILLKCKLGLVDCWVLYAFSAGTAKQNMAHLVSLYLHPYSIPVSLTQNDENGRSHMWNLFSTVRAIVIFWKTEKR